MNKILNLLGLAKKARKLVLVTDTSVAMLKSNKLTLLVIATDASDSTYDKLEKKAYFYQVPVMYKFTTEELSNALGVNQVKVIGITDAGFASAILKEVERGDF